MSRRRHRSSGFGGFLGGGGFDDCYDENPFAHLEFAHRLAMQEAIDPFGVNGVNPFGPFGPFGGGGFGGYGGGGSYIRYAVVDRNHPFGLPPPSPHGTISELGRMWLYHATTQEAGGSILSSKTMRAGVTGMVGGAIYFATTPEDALRKCRMGESGCPHDPSARASDASLVVLRCLVNLGRVLSPNNTKATYTPDSMGRIGADTVKVTWGNGDEYAVFSSGQVKEITVLSR